MHSKIKKEEAEKLAQVIADRLNQTTGTLKVILPLKGFCEAGAQGKNYIIKRLTNFL